MTITAEESLLSLIGLGSDIWKDEDAQTYVSKLRNEWDDPTEGIVDDNHSERTLRRNS